MELEGLLVLIRTGGWVPFAAAIVGALVRLTKDDTKVPVNVPAEWRPWLAMALGLLQGVLVHVAAGVTWKAALLGGVGAGAMAVVGHVLGIEVMNDGKELPVPGLMKEEKK